MFFYGEIVCIPPSPLQSPAPYSHRYLPSAVAETGQMRDSYATVHTFFLTKLIARLMRKIMQYTDRNTGRLADYIPAKLTEGKKEWYVSYYATDPYCGILKRKKIKINRIRGMAEKRRYARHLIEQINRRLRTGWNPFVEAIAPKGAEPLVAAMQQFLKRKRTELRPQSMRSYESHCGKIAEWLQGQKKQATASAAFGPGMARDYMEHLLDRGVGPNTYNNAITFGRVLFNWMKERHYCAANPFQEIKRMRPAEKTRKLIPQDWREKVSAYLARENPGFLLCCMLQFYAQIRPGEQIRLHVRDIDLANKVIVVPGAAAKTRTARYPTIPDALMPYLLNLPWSSLRGGDFLVGAHFLPGSIPLSDTRQYTLHWKRMRAALNMPSQYQFYSLRDSGIVHLLDMGVPINKVMIQAGHADLHTTTKYVRHLSPSAVVEIKHLKKGF